MRKLFMTLAATFVSISAWAYVPDYSMIMSRTAENHGRGLYQIEQDVVFRGDPDPLVVKETWLIGGEGGMRVTFEGKGALKGLIQGTYVYDSSSRYFVEATGQTKSSRLSDDWLEPFFHFRFSKNIKPRLVALQIAPAESLKDRVATPPPANLPPGTPSEFKYQPQIFLRLSRTGGSISWAIGTPTPEGSAQGLPGLWIEQDQFVVRKIRLPSQVMVTADQYMRQPENLWLPKVRTISWAANSVQIHVSAVHSLGKASKQGELLKPSTLDGRKAPGLINKLPDQDAIREFYQRFR